MHNLKQLTKKVNNLYVIEGDCGIIFHSEYKCHVSFLVSKSNIPFIVLPIQNFCFVYRYRFTAISNYVCIDIYRNLCRYLFLFEYFNVVF